MNAIALLREDHRKVKGLFKEIGRAQPDRRDRLFNEIKTELTIHTELEERLLYPTAREARPTHGMTLESLEEHKQMKLVLSDLSKSDKMTDTWLAGCKVLIEDVEHHIEEEEGELFPRIERDVLSASQLDALGRRMEEMKHQLLEHVR